jgi:hypothetical protein
LLLEHSAQGLKGLCAFCSLEVKRGLGKKFSVRHSVTLRRPTSIGKLFSTAPDSGLSES